MPISSFIKTFVKKYVKVWFLFLMGGVLLMGTLSGCENKENFRNKIAVIKTNFGDMTFEFYPDVAPKAVENFLTHSQNGYYDGLIFHRVIKDFMIQGGDPNGDGTGGESIWGGTFGYEFSDKVTHEYGALAMAHSMMPDSNGSQFYIVNNKEGTHWLDGEHTVFGKLVEGFDTLEKISEQQTDSNDKPVNDVVINKIEVVVQKG